MAPLSCTIEADERVSAAGEVVRGLNETDLRAKLEGLKAKNIEALTVSLINAYANDAHERRIADGFEDVVVNVHDGVMGYGLWVVGWPVDPRSSIPDRKV